MRAPGNERLSPDIFSKRPVSGNLFSLLPVDGRESLSVASGRSALAKGLDSLPKDMISGRAWLPSLCCPSIAYPFLRRGFRLFFYSSPESASLPRFLPGDVFLYIHFCGFPNRSAEAALKAIPVPERPFIFEDCVHALFTPGVGMFGDFILYSFRKFLPVPDGGLLISRFPLDTKLEPPMEFFVSCKVLGSLTGDCSRLRRGEDLLDGDDEARAPSEMGRFLLERTEWESIPSRRRHNAARLSDLLGFSLPGGAESVPLGVPFSAEKGKDELERRLRAAGFEPPLSWDCPPGAPDDEASRTVVLPCGEELEEADLREISAICGTDNSGTIAEQMIDNSLRTGYPEFGSLG